MTLDEVFGAVKPKNKINNLKLEKEFALESKFVRDAISGNRNNTE